MSTASKTKVLKATPKPVSANPAESVASMDAKSNLSIKIRDNELHTHACCAARSSINSIVLLITKAIAPEKVFDNGHCRYECRRAVPQPSTGPAKYMRLLKYIVPGAVCCAIAGGQQPKTVTDGLNVMGDFILKANESRIISAPAHGSTEGIGNIEFLDVMGKNVKPTGPWAIWIEFLSESDVAALNHTCCHRATAAADTAASGAKTA